MAAENQVLKHFYAKRLQQGLKQASRYTHWGTWPISMMQDLCNACKRAYGILNTGHIIEIFKQMVMQKIPMPAEFVYDILKSCTRSTRPFAQLLPVGLQRDIWLDCDYYITQRRDWMYAVPVKGRRYPMDIYRALNCPMPLLKRMIADGMYYDGDVANSCCGEINTERISLLSHATLPRSLLLHAPWIVNAARTDFIIALIPALTYDLSQVHLKLFSNRCGVLEYAIDCNLTFVLDSEEISTKYIQKRHERQTQIPLLLAAHTLPELVSLIRSF